MRKAAVRVRGALSLRASREHRPGGIFQKTDTPVGPNARRVEMSMEGVQRRCAAESGSGSFGVKATITTTGLLPLTGLVCSDKLTI